MQWKVFLLLGAFIFECGFRSTTAAITCTFLDNTKMTAVLTKINDLRAKINPLRGNLTVPDPHDDKHKKLLEETSNKADKLESTDVLIYNGNINVTDQKVEEIIDQWIGEGNDYKNPTNISDKIKPYARLIWKKSQTVECAICTDQNTPPKISFKCLFDPAAKFDDINEMKDNLPPAISEPTEPTVPGPGSGSNDPVRGESAGGLSSFEKIVRTFTLISSIATTIIVALGFVITLLVAIKIFLI